MLSGKSGSITNRGGVSNGGHIENVVLNYLPLEIDELTKFNQKESVCNVSNTRTYNYRAALKKP
jgi:hypothetical protein